MKSIKSQPTIFIIYGATGDLCWRKLAPALFNLFLDGWMPEKFTIIGTGRTPLSDDDFRNKMLEGINNFSRSGKAAEPQWQLFAGHVRYTAGDVNKPEGYSNICEIVESNSKEWNAKPYVIHYLAVAPTLFPVIAKNIAANKLNDEGLCRIVIEKPFGHDLESARALNQLLNENYREEQIYRIDHYLGKETVQNIMAFRFANSILEPLWNRNYIQHIQISVTEQLGVEGRGGYYEGSGALRDMVQNHILQLLCLIAMEPPVSFRAAEVHNRKLDVLTAMRRFSPEALRSTVVRGQYGGGWLKGKEVPGYREEPDVNPSSNTETFTAIKFFIDNWRWQGVPFYIRTGKRLAESSSLISIQFRDLPHFVFPPEAIDSWQQNRLIISIQPEMSIRLQLQGKRPGLDMLLNTVDMVFDYKTSYSSYTPEAYETLLLDTMTGDQTLFMRGDQVEAAWDLLMPVINMWTNKPSVNFPNYSAGSWGPELAEAMIAGDGYHWFSLPVNGKH
ncbi:glucose-6-phosphate dehydrogenase [Pollutibacter soli]|uniref:glucose-6-phosphate dehydrogenase n=1 Tax=Pollutibacter soli TaxID=3034157 RepID=UPI00301394BA